MFKMKSNNIESNNKLESSLSFSHLNSILPNHNNNNFNNMPAAIDIWSPYLSKNIGINGHAFKNSNLKTQEVVDNNLVLHKTHLNEVFSRSFTNLNKLIARRHSMSNRVISISETTDLINTPVNNEKPKTKRIDFTGLNNENVFQIRPSSLTDLSDRLRKMYSTSLENTLDNKSIVSKKISAQTKILYNLSKIHMQNKLQLLNKIGNRYSRINY